MLRNFSRQKDRTQESSNGNVNSRFIRTTQTFYRKRPAAEPKEPESVGKHPDIILRHGEQYRESMSTCISKDGSVVVQGFEDGKLGVWDINNKKFTATEQKYSSRPVRQVCLSVDGRIAAAIFLDGNIVAFSTETMREISSLKFPRFVQGWGIAITADGNVLYASLAQDADFGKILRYDLTTMESMTVWSGHYKAFEVYCSYDGSRVMFFRQNNIINVVDVVENIEKMPIQYSFEYMKGNYDAAMDARGKTLAISDFKTVIVHKLLEGSNHSSISAENYIVQWNFSRKCDISADGSRFIEMKRRGILVRDAVDGKILRTLTCQERLVTCRISADGTVVIGIDFHANLIIWKTDNLPKCDISFLEKNSVSFAEMPDRETEKSVYELELPQKEANVVEDLDPTTPYGTAVEHFENTVDEKDEEISIDVAKEKIETLVRSKSSRKNIPDDLESVVSDAVSEVVGGKETVAKEEYGSIAETVTNKLEDVEVPAEWESTFESYAGKDNILSLYQAVTVLLEVWESTTDKSKTRYPTKPGRLEMRKILIKFDSDNDLLIGKDEFLNTLRYMLEPVSL